LNAALDAIRERPDEDDPRLALAERLDDGPRAELIRLQCALARTDGHDPARAELESAVCHIAMDPRWTSTLESAGLVMPTLRPSEPWHFKPPWTFRRGFVEHMFATGEQIAAAGAAIAEDHPVRSLAVSKLTKATAAALLQLPWLRFVENLSTDASPAALTVLLTSPAVRIRRLRISVEGRALAGLLALHAVAHLRALDVDVVDDQAAAAAALADGAPTSLEELRFGSAPTGWGSATGQRTTSARQAGPELGRALRSVRLAHLRRLALEGVEDAAADAAAEALAEHPALEELSTGRSVSDPVAARLASCVIPRLRALRLEQAGPACAASIASARAPRLIELVLEPGTGQRMPANATRDALAGLDAPELRALRLRGCGLDAGVVSAIQGMHAPRLASLDLLATLEVVPAGTLKALVEGPLASRLSTLSFTCSPSSLADVRAIADATLPALRRLSLVNAPRDGEADVAIRALAECAGMPELRHLGFRHAGNIASFGNDGGGALLTTRSNLAILYVNPTGMTAATRKKLSARFAVYPGADWTTDWLPFVARGHLEA
jgi:uncharacterized protein (TIGR02996 family)